MLHSDAGPPQEPPEPMPQRVGEPEDIAQCALFLASESASFISGAQIVVGGGAMAVGA